MESLTLQAYEEVDSYVNIYPQCRHVIGASIPWLLCSARKIKHWASHLGKGSLEKRQYKFTWHNVSFFFSNGM